MRQEEEEGGRKGGGEHVLIHLLDRQLLLFIANLVQRIIDITGEPDAFGNILSRPRTRSLNPRGAGFPDLLIKAQTSGNIGGEVIFLGENNTQRSGILQCLTRSLALVWHHGVRGIAHNGRLAD